MPLGSLLSPSWSVNGLSLTTYPYSVEMDGIDYGPPDLTTEILVSFLTRGDVENRSHVGNRTLTLPIMIEGQSLQAIAAAQGALERALDVPFGALVCDPGDGVAPAFQFVVFQGVLNFQHSSPGEMAGVRRYVLTFRAEPDVYSSSLTTVPALAASGSTTNSVDTGSSASGWAATVNGAMVTPTVVSGAVRAQAGSAGTALTTITMARTGAITTSSLKYLVVDWRPAPGATPTGFVAAADGVALTRVASGPSPTAGYTRTTFRVAAASVAVLTVTLTAGTTHVPLIQSLSIDRIDVSDVRPMLGTPAQQLRTISIIGSAPTVGSIALEHSSAALGDAVIYTCPDDGSGYVPACRTYKTSVGSATPDTTAVSGFYDTVTSSALNMVYGIVNTALPDGEYLVMGRLSAGSSVSSTVTVSAFGAMAGVPVGTIAQAIRTVALTSTWTLFPLGMLHLPPTDMSDGPTSLTNISVQTSVSTRLDELYLFNLTNGRLTQVACDTASAAAGGPANRLWIDSPTVDNQGLGRYLMGFSADRSDAYSAYPSAQAVGIHEFPAGSLKVFTVATNTAATTAADCSFTYYAAWSHHAAS